MSTISEEQSLFIEGEGSTLAIEKHTAQEAHTLIRGDTIHYVTYACPLRYFGNHRNVLM